MTNKLRCVIVFSGILICSLTTKAQLTINGASFTIESGATVTVQGNMSSNVDIGGTGKILMKGASLQNLNMNGFTIPNIEIDNVNNVSLTGNTRIGSSILFTNGKFQLGTNTLTLGSGLTSAGMGTNKFLETNGTGFVLRELTADISNSITPVGTGTDYTPVSLTNSGSSYTLASIGVQAKGIADPNKHPRSESYLTVYWPINKTGITGGTTSAVGTYADPSRVTGTEADLTGMFWNGSNWSTAGGSQSAALNTAGASVSSANGELYAMNTFVLVAPKAFLQGAYNTGNGLMNDKLRNSAATYTPGVLPASNLIPNSDPYRVAPYNFAETNNSVAENVISTSFANPFIDQADPNNNIVDWVFLELRSATTPGNTILQTRSALLQRDGDIVDIDGVSPVYFKKLTAGASYTLAVRHRNHLPMSTNPATFTKTLNLVSSGLDFSIISSTSLMGAANTNYLNNGSKNLLYAGNGNGNNNIKYIGLANDKDFILVNTLNNNAALPLQNVYNAADLNLNRIVNYNGLANDKDIILVTVLQNSASAQKLQALPN